MRPSLLAACLLALATASSAASAAGQESEGKESDGVVRSVMTSTHITFGKLGIGVLAARVSAYLDEKEVRQHGLHARLSLSVAKDPAARREVALAAGQTVTVAGYRVKVEAVNSGERGGAVLRLWAPPPEPAKPARKWPFSWFKSGEK